MTPKANNSRRNSRMLMLPNEHSTTALGQVKIFFIFSFIFFNYLNMKYFCQKKFGKLLNFK